MAAPAQRSSSKPVGLVALLSLAGAVAVGQAAVADVTYTFVNKTFAGWQFDLMSAAGELQGTLTGASIDVLLNESIAYTYADDLCVYLDAGSFATGGALQIGGFSTLAATQRLQWGCSDKAWPPVCSRTVTLYAPISLTGSNLNVWIGNGYSYPQTSGTWTGTITLHGVSTHPWYRDVDEDGWGHAPDGVVWGSQPPGYVANDDDNCPSIYNPGQEDCNTDGIGDVCSIAAAALRDCDGDSVPDVCEGAVAVSQTSPMAHISGAQPINYTFTGLPRASGGQPKLRIEATADLGGVTDGLLVAIEGGAPTAYFGTNGTDCPASPDVASIAWSIPAFNALVADGTLAVQVTSFGAVNSSGCSNGGVRLKLEYEGLPTSADCNGNGLLDSCEIGTGAQPDCNANGKPDLCDLAAGIATDCNANGVLDACELSSGAAQDCNANGTLDSCDIAAGTSLDCNTNGKPDSCDLAAGTSTDLNGNSIPDDCFGEFVVGGSGFASIQEAINVAPDGTTIRAAPGTYGPIDLSARNVTVQALGSASNSFIDGGGVTRAVIMSGLVGPGASIRGFTIRNGRADRGAGVFVENGTLALVDCIVRDNVATDLGGGVAAIDAGVTLMRTTVTSNVATSGGGVAAVRIATQRIVQVVDSDVLSNSASANGGGVRNAGRVVLTNTRLRQNTSGGSGGGLATGVGALSQVGGSYFCQNTPENVAGPITEVQANVFTQDCDSDGNCDADEILSGAEQDCNVNGLPDACELSTGSAQDCNGNGKPDSCDIAAGTSLDCNANGRPDSCDLAAGTSTDLDGNSIPDECSGEFIVGGSGYANIQAAINAAPNGATIRVAAGTYPPVVLSGRQLTLKSLTGAATTFIDGGGSARCVNMIAPGSGVSLIEGFTLRNGRAGNGGAVNVVGAALEIRSCVLRDNVATNVGGAVAALDAAVSLVDSEIRSNSALRGGGVHAEADSASVFVVIDGCLLTGNTASGVGGAMSNAGFLRVVDSVVVANVAEQAGGGLWTQAGSVSEIGEAQFCRNTPVNLTGSYVDLGGNTFSQDCDADGVCDAEEIQSGAEVDCNSNGVLDACELTSGADFDCNENGVLDSCDIATGTSTDVDSNLVPDDCQPDCDGDGLPDSWELSQALADDCNGNAIPDNCEIAQEPSTDKNANGSLDACELARGDLNLDGVINAADLAVMLAFWGVPNPPVGDLDGNGVINGADLAGLLVNWGTTP